MTLRSRLLDAGLAAGSAVLTLVSLFVGSDPPISGDRLWVTPLLLVPSAALLLRRTQPLLTTALVWLPIAVHAVVTGRGAEGPFLIWPAWVSLYALTAYGRRREILAGLGVTLVSLGLHDWFDPGRGGRGRNRPGRRPGGTSCWWSRR